MKRKRLEIDPKIIEEYFIAWEKTVKTLTRKQALFFLIGFNEASH